MKTKARFLSILLAVLLCGSACSSNTVSAPEKDPSGTETQSGETQTSETVPDETVSAEPLDNLPKDLDYQGKDVNIAYYNGNTKELVAELTGDVVGDAVYTRNLNVMDRLNIKLNMVDSGAGFTEMPSFISKIVSAGDSTYDIVDGFQYGFSTLLNGQFVNLTESEYLDIEQPWWATDYIDEMHIGDNKLFFVSGAANLRMTDQMSCVYFNKTVLERYSDGLGLDSDGMYQLILDHQWTLDRMYSLARIVCNDNDGNGIYDSADTYGLGSITSNLSWHTFMNAGGRFTEYDAEGLPVICAGNEKNINIIEQILTMCNDPNIYFAEPSEAGLQELITMLSRDQLLFKIGFFHDIYKLREMESEYGILPCPKYDESQEKYLSLIHDQASTFAVPTSCEDADFSCIILEAIASESHKIVTPAYYETALKTKYVRDSISGQVIDIIHQGATSDVAFIYASQCGDLMNRLVGEVLRDGTNIFASKWAKIEKSATKGLERFVKAFLK